MYIIILAVANDTFPNCPKCCANGCRLGLCGDPKVCPGKILKQAYVQVRGFSIGFFTQT